MSNAIEAYRDVLRIKNVRVYTLVTFLSSLAFYSVVSTLFYQSRGLTYTGMFLMEGVLSAAIFLLEIPSGVLADRVGRRKLVIAATACAAISSIVAALSHSLWLFLLESAVAGIGIACLSGADEALIYTSLEKEGLSQAADTAFALFGSASKAALAISLVFGGWLAEYSLSLPVYLSCIPLVLASGLAFLLEEDPSVRAAEGAPTVRWWMHLSLLRQMPLLAALRVFSSLAFIAGLSMHYLNQPLFLSLGIPLRHFGAIMLLANLVSVGASLFAPAIARKLGQPLAVALPLMISGLAFLMLPQLRSPVIGVGAILAILTMDALRMPIYRTFVNDQLQGRNRATSLSVLGFLGSLVSMLVKPSVGMVADLNFSLALIAIGAMLLLTAIVHLSLMGHINRRSPGYGQSAV